MLENARRQLLIVLLIAVAAALSLVFKWKDIRLGLDLRGGTQLIYEINPELEKAKGRLPENAGPDQITKIVDETVAIIRERIDPTGTLDAVVTRRGDIGILIELPEMDDTDSRAIEKLVSELGRLELRIVASDAYSAEDVRFEIAKEKQRLTEWLDADEGANRTLCSGDPDKIALYNNLPLDQKGEGASRWIKWFPSRINPSADNPTQWARADSWTVTGGPRGAESPCVPAFGAAEYNGGQVEQGVEHPFLAEFYPINMHEVLFTGEDLDPAAIRPGLDEYGRPAILYRMKPAQIGAYAKWSEDYIDERSAIILNGDVYSAPTFVSRIYGNAQITGDFTDAQVAQLVKVLKTGSLKVQPALETRTVIGPTLGKRSIELGMYSMIAGGTLVLAFILAYYKLAGVVAFAAIALNILLILASILAIRATLTLPGIAGLVLTMGMAVDANILIYERIREELGRGKELLQAVRTGFDRAMVTILDANITTFIAGLVLYWVGVGPIRGFAVTLMIGIVTTLFTAFFVSRLVFHYLLAFRKLSEFRVASWVADLNIDFLRWRRVALAGSGLVIVLGLANTLFVVPRDVTLGLDFTGGANLRVVLTEPTTATVIREKLHADAEFGQDFPDPIVNTVGAPTPDGATEFSIKLKLTDDLRAEIQENRSKDPDYQPPYLTGLTRALGGMLVPDAYSEALVLPNAQQPTAQFAEIVLHFARPVGVSDVQQLLVESYGGDPEVASTDVPGADTGTNLRLQYDVGTDVTADMLFPALSEVLKGLVAADGEPVKLSEPIPESEQIGDRMVGELRNAAIAALLVSMFLIVMFIRLRFHEYKYGIAAVLALVHDVLVTLGVVVLFNALGLVHAELDLAMIAAFLTIIGYSINDTIVIFDRVRENLNEQRRLGERIVFNQLLNRSINQTLSRTILTTTTTLFVLITQFVVNYGSTTVLEGFSFALIVGLVSGTYSTIFIASPIVSWLWSRDRHGGAPSGEAASASAAQGAPVPAQTGV